MNPSTEREEHHDSDLFANIPDELKAFPQHFVCWKLEPDAKTGKLTKKPYIAGTRQHASCSDPSTWCDFPDAARAYREDPTGFYNGIGIEMTLDMGLVGIDLDHCIDPDTEAIAEWAQKIVGRFPNTYWEKSPSGLGVRGFVRGTLPPHGRKKGPIELYNSDRFFTLTGNRLDSAPAMIPDGYADELLAFHVEIFGKEEAKPKPQPPGAANGQDRSGDRGFIGSDEELLAAAKSAQNGEKFARLWAGDHTGYHSQSEADQALCNLLTFWCGRDPARIDRLFRQSKLHREKWDEPHYGDGRTYGTGTIEKALSGVKEFYSPHEGRNEEEEGPSSTWDGEHADAEDTITEARATLDAFILEAEQQPDAIIEKTLKNQDRVRAFAFLANRDRGAWESALFKLRKAQVKEREINSLLRTVNQARKQLLADTEGNKPPLLPVHQTLPDAPLPPTALVPRGWSLSRNATSKRIVRQTEKGLKEEDHPVAPSPLVIAGRLKDVVDDTESVRLSWFRDSRWQSHTTGREVIATTRKLVDIATVGLPVTTLSAPDLVQFLALFEAENLSILPKARVSKQMGWLGKSGKLGFLWGRTLIREDGTHAADIDLDTLSPEDWREDFIAFHGADSGDEQLADGFCSEGSFEGWVRTVTPIAAYPRVLLVVYASLAPPLLPVIGAPNFCADWCGYTSQGKTTTLRVGASVWGCPDERAPAAALGTWDASRVWIERAAAVLNNLPVILDDTKRAKQPKQIAQTLYDITSGRGRGRGSPQGMRRAGSWATVGLFSGEAQAVSFTEDGGTRARVLTLWGPPFGKADETTAALVLRLNQGLQQHYGHAGPRFVAYVASHREKWEEWRTQYQWSLSVYLTKAGDNPIAGRLASYFAALDQVAVIAHEALNLPWQYRDPVAALWEDLIREAGEADRAAYALSLVVSWAHGHAQEFYGRHVTRNGNPMQPLTGWAGRWEPEENWDSLAFLPHKVRELLKAHGFEPDAILRLWRDRDWLDVDPGRDQKQVRIDDTRPRTYAIKRSAIELACQNTDA